MRWMAAGLLWVLAGLLGLVGGLLCVTIILLPLGIPVIMLARRLFTRSVRLVVPQPVKHPAKESEKAFKGRGKDVGEAAKGGAKAVRKQGRKALKNTRDAMPSPVADVMPKPRRGLLGRIGIGSG
jgi:UPF0716 family protein affecting phage T7 exclusion